MIKDFLRNHLDNINSLLVIIAFAIAIAIPLELFLFTYAVIGPMHYLSEIAWLDKKNFGDYKFLLFGFGTLFYRLSHRIFNYDFFKYGPCFFRISS
jgi:hypothetical protein